MRLKIYPRRVIAAVGIGIKQMKALVEELSRISKIVGLVDCDEPRRDQTLRPRYEDRSEKRNEGGKRQYDGYPPGRVCRRTDRPLSKSLCRHVSNQADIGPADSG